MNKVIYKYPLLPDTTLDLPVYFQILHIGTQDDQPFVWILQEQYSQNLIRIHIKSYATGETIYENLGQYLGTTQFDDSVFHFFKL